jgi:Tfp pilus assembly PilM family ATPase
VDLGKDTNVEGTSEAAAHIAKIIRNVMSRLHGEISRSINIYRSTQGGSTPTTIYLTGGSSILT